MATHKIVSETRDKSSCVGAQKHFCGLANVPFLAQGKYQHMAEKNYGTIIAITENLKHKQFLLFWQMLEELDGKWSTKEARETIRGAQLEARSRVSWLKIGETRLKQGAAKGEDTSATAKKTRRLFKEGRKAMAPWLFIFLTILSYRWNISHCRWAEIKNGYPFD